MKRALVIGAGPAGLIAAEVLARAGLGVTVIDRMASPGRKFLMAGRGGLNLTHSEPLDPFVARYGPDSERVAALVRHFPPAALCGFADALGAETFIGSSGRVFPRAMKASPLLRAWLARLDGLGVERRTRTRCLAIGKGPRVLVEMPDGGKEQCEADAVILALGGASWPRLGSDGAWRDWPALPVEPLQPSNCGIRIRWSAVFSGRFAGTPLKPLALSVSGERVRGEAMITLDGLEGQAVYAMSRAIRQALRSGRSELVADLAPEMTHIQLARRISKALARKGTNTSEALRRAGLPPASIGLMREARADLPRDAEALAVIAKAVTLPIGGLGGFERAISTAGGVRFDALDEGLMLKSLPGVFIAGEMLDFDAPTGGYLLQAAFASGIAAGEGAARFLGAEAGPLPGVDSGGCLTPVAEGQVPRG